MNKIFIIGNLTRDPELRTTQTGVNVCTMTVAVNRKGKDKETDFFKVTCWRGLADVASKYLSKGKKVSVVGQVGISSYKGKDGEMHHQLEVIADDLEMLSPKGDGYEQQEREAIQTETGGFTQVQTEDLPF